jgi:enoyl-CoA hydratase/carnithine racemase
MSAGTVTLAVPEPRIATLTLAGATPLNIFDLAMRDGLIEALEAVRDHPDVDVVVVRSAGQHFSAGADLREFGGLASTMERRRVRWDRDPWTLLWELPQPTIVALRGVAMGAGLELALLCDLRLAAPDVVLSLPEPRLGMLPSAGGTQSALRALGASRALALCLLADRLDAAQGRAEGILDELHEDVDGAALALARRIAGTPRATLRAARRLVHASLDRTLDEGLALERLLGGVHKASR